MTPRNDSDPTAAASHPWSASHEPVAVAMQLRPGAAAWMAIPAFRDLPEDAIRRLEKLMQPRKFAIDAPLMCQGDPGDGFLVVESGRVRVTVCDDNGEVVFQRFIDAPAVLGEAAVLTGEKRTATITAQAPVHAFFVDSETLRNLCAAYPPTAAFLTALVGDRLMASDSIRKVGKYEVTGRLGSGGVATVFAAVHPQLDRPVALKMLSHALVFDRAFASHFVSEARLVAQLDHPNIVRVYDTEKAYGTHFIVMEKLSGDVLHTPADGGQMRSWASVRRILVQVLDALAYSHSRGLIHRDIKPSNVFMTRDGIVKLLDFGIAMDMDGPSVREGKILGTPAYMSPEQASGQRLDGRSDLYSTGILAYELCTGMRPFRGDTSDAILRAHVHAPMPDPRVLAPDIPDEIAEFILNATAKAPADRQRSCAEAADKLRVQDARAGDEHGVATLAVTFPQSRRTELERAIEEMAARIRLIRGARVVLATEVSNESPALSDPSERRLTNVDPTKATQRPRPNSGLNPHSAPNPTLRPEPVNE
jgi:serine/threonine protein kinase